MYDKIFVRGQKRFFPHRFNITKITHLSQSSTRVSIQIYVIVCLEEKERYLNLNV